METNPASATITDRYMEVLEVRNRCEDWLSRCPDDQEAALLLVMADQELELLAKELPF